MKQYTLTNPMAAQSTPISLADKSPLQKVANEPKKAEVIYLGVDVHLRQQVVCRRRQYKKTGYSQRERLQGSIDRHFLKQGVKNVFDFAGLTDSQKSQLRNYITSKPNWAGRFELLED